MKCTSTVSKIGAVQKVYNYSDKKMLQNGECTSVVSRLYCTVQTILLACQAKA
jgi:hypothetical protein